MVIESTTPVLVGVAQIRQKPDDLATAVEAVDLMESALHRAADDTGRPAIVSMIDQLAVVQGAWSYSDPGRLLAQRLAPAREVHTILSGSGGQTPQALVNLACARIAAGEAEVAAVVGAETIWSRRRLRRAGLAVPKTTQSGIDPDEIAGDDIAMSTELEHDRGMEAPINFYPVFESAIRHRRGESHDQHRRRVSELWARFNRVAVSNPYSWSSEPLTAEEIRRPSAENRMVGYPYTKAMNSNWDLDLGAALILCSAARATTLGIDRERWIFPLAGTEAKDTLSVTNRRDLHSSPAIEAAGRTLFSMTGVDVEQIDLVDLYSCFPSAVQVAAEALGIDQDRPLTVTGGLTFAGGPLNNYVTHSIATMAERLREVGNAADRIGLVTANGGYLTKHALGLYATRPGTGQFERRNVQHELVDVPTVEAVSAIDGTATIEAYTVMHDRSGPTEALLAIRSNGSRSWGRSKDPDLMSEFLTEEAIGQPVGLDEHGIITRR